MRSWRLRSLSASAVGYQSAGTVEFVVDGDEFFFLELNGRIQVEHPVTEAVTGLDLIAEQFRIAAGESPLHQAGTRWTGTPSRCACMPRIPAASCRRPAASSGSPCQTELRVDAGVEEGDEIGLAYDPMIAKLVARGRNREEALEILAAALAETEVAGVTTNLPFLRWLVSHPVVRAGEATTAFLTEHPPLSPRPLLAAPKPVEPFVAAEPGGASARAASERRLSRGCPRAGAR